MSFLTDGIGLKSTEWNQTGSRPQSTGLDQARISPELDTNEAEIDRMGGNQWGKIDMISWNQTEMDRRGWNLQVVIVWT